jgi:hypothetical protein
MKETIKGFFFISLLIFLLLPLIQHTTRFFKEKPLDGAFVKPNKPEFSFEKWFSSEYQESFSEFFNSQIGFRPFLIRLRNQISYSFFNESAEPDFVIGKNNYFFNSANIASVTGDDFAGVDFISGQMKKLKVIQDSMHARGVPVIYVIAPGRANFFTKNILENYKISDSVKTNYYWLSKKLQENKINHIDFNKYFLNLKDTCQSLLFTKGGLHWSDYGLALAFDSIIKYLKSFNKNDIGEFTIKSYSKSHIPKVDDVDQERSLNLLLPLKYEEYTYAHWEIKNNKKKPKLLDVGDSFFMSFVIDTIAAEFFDYEYWYYHHLVYWPLKNSKIDDIENINYFDDIFEQDYIMLLSAEGTWNKCGYDFVDNLYSYFTNRKNSILILNMNFLLWKIMGKEGWLKQTEFYNKNRMPNTKVKRNSISVNEIVTKEAYAEIEWDLHLTPESKASVQTMENYLNNSEEIKKIIHSMFGNRMRFEKETLHLIASYLQSKNINYETLAYVSEYVNKK